MAPYYRLTADTCRWFARPTTDLKLQVSSEREARNINQYKTSQLYETPWRNNVRIRQFEESLGFWESRRIMYELSHCRENIIVEVSPEKYCPSNATLVEIW